jgi:hypothetical protein
LFSTGLFFLLEKFVKEGIKNFLRRGHPYGKIPSGLSRQWCGTGKAGNPKSERDIGDIVLVLFIPEKALNCFVPKTFFPGSPGP